MRSTRTKQPVEEDEVHVEVVTVDGEPLLSPDEREALAHFERKRLDAFGGHERADTVRPFRTRRTVRRITEIARRTSVQQFAAPEAARRSGFYSIRVAVWWKAAGIHRSEGTQQGRAKSQNERQASRRSYRARPPSPLRKFQGGIHRNLPGEPRRIPSHHKARSRRLHRVSPGPSRRRHPSRARVHESVRRFQR